ncbi:hypothetical protein KJ611_01245 [Patescibacteria group bacterium]|nr:hypothetical protein [Patescibacteria group bacterium]
MNYQPTYQRSTPKRGSGGIGTVFILMILVALFVYAVYEFRRPKAEPAPLMATIEDVMKPSPLLVSVEGNSKEIVDVEKADLRAVFESDGQGVATRQIEDGIYFHTVKASLPAIDRERYFYEGWLVRQVPYNYFSTGEMFTNNLSEFVLRFEGDPRGAYDNYTQVVITLELRDDNPDPADHVLEGEFIGQVFEKAEAREYWDTFYPPGLEEEE